jgi:acyl-CoA synthetase (AMP-forming)/AMP-acid ligase II
MQNINEPTAAEGATGYKRPPVEHQFPKGKSGNPSGRRKGQRNLATVLDEVLAQTVKVKHGNKSEVMTKGEACIKILMSKAHNGDHRAVEALTTLTEKIGRLEERPKDVLNNFGFMLVPGTAETREEWEEMVRMQPVSPPWETPPKKQTPFELARAQRNAKQAATPGFTKKDMIKNGRNIIYPFEIEEALLAHPSVAEVAVVGIPHETMGQAVHAVIVFQPSLQVASDILLNHCRERLPPHRFPESFEYRLQLPRNANGEVLRSVLRTEASPQVSIAAEKNKGVVG